MFCLSFEIPGNEVSIVLELLVFFLFILLLFFFLEVSKLVAEMRVKKMNNVYPAIRLVFLPTCYEVCYEDYIRFFVAPFVFSSYRVNLNVTETIKTHLMVSLTWGM